MFWKQSVGAPAGLWGQVRERGRETERSKQPLLTLTLWTVEQGARQASRLINIPQLQIHAASRTAERLRCIKASLNSGEEKYSDSFLMATDCQQDFIMSRAVQVTAASIPVTQSRATNIIFPSRISLQDLCDYICLFSALKGKPKGMNISLNPMERE